MSRSRRNGTEPSEAPHDLPVPWQERTLRYDEFEAIQRRHREEQPAIPVEQAAIPVTRPEAGMQPEAPHARRARPNRTLLPEEFAALLQTGAEQEDGSDDASAQHSPAATPAPTLLDLRVEQTPAEFSHLYASLERQATGLGNVTLLPGDGLGATAPYVLGVTSAVAGEGKTTVALHLAMTIARDTFKKVCLLEMSLGHSDLVARLGVPETGDGVVAVLEGSGTVVPTLQLAGCENLVIIPAGKAPMQPAKLARSPRVEQLIVSARYAFDVIIVDLPAVSSDNVLPLARPLDGLLMVVRAGATPQDVVNSALDMVGRDKVLGVTLNRVPPPHKSWPLPAWLRGGKNGA